MSITSETSLEELAVQVSEALEKAGVKAVLSGGAAVSIYSENAYESADLDFVTSAGKKILVSALDSLGFTNANGSRMFEHPHTHWYVEFPSGPLGFGDTFIDPSEIPLLRTQYGEIRIITPTLSVIDRLAAYWYHFDSQCWDQAGEVVKRHNIDWNYVYKWAKKEKHNASDIDELKRMWN